MREMVLLGAGASIDAGVPAAYNMTEKLIDLFQKDIRLSRYSQVINFAVGGLLFQQGIRGENPFNGVNVEELFSAIQLLADRQNLEAAPFIGSWHPLVDTLDKLAPPSSNKYTARKKLQDLLEELVKDTIKIIADKVCQTNHFRQNDIEKELKSIVKNPNNNSNFGKLIYQIIQDPFKQIKANPNFNNSHQLSQKFYDTIETINTNYLEQPSEGKIFEDTNEWLIQKLIELVWIEDESKIDYLIPLLTYINKNNITIASLNYDNAIELAAKKSDIIVNTGIEEWSTTGQFPEIEQGILLLKLHGSIDWALKNGDCNHQRPLPYQIITQVSSSSIKEYGFKPAIIFGQRNKLTAKGPFLELLRAFERELSQAERLTVIGYSFRDTHINEFIFQWLNKDFKRGIRIINGKRFKIDNLPVNSQFIEFLEPRIEIISNYAKEGITQCFA